MIYLAAPYNHPDKEVVQKRMEALYDIMAILMNIGKHVVTPLFMHEVVVRHELPSTFEFWRAYCFDILKRCDEMIIVNMQGWDTSEGIAAEIKFCEENNIKVSYYWEPYH